MSAEEAGGSRDRILNEAKRLFAARGYSALSMREIAESVQFSKAALYHHFRDKEELFVAILTSYLDVLESLITGAEEEGQSCREQISLFVRRVLSQPSDERAIIRLASQEMAQLSLEARQNFNALYHSKFIDRIGAMIHDGIRAGELRPVDQTVATWALLGMMYPYLYPTHRGDVGPADAAIEELLVIYFDGASAVQAS